MPGTAAEMRTLARLKTMSNPAKLKPLDALCVLEIRPCLTLI
jgi:hypothetical protein